MGGFAGAQVVDGRVFQIAHRFRGAAGADAAVVFAPHDIPDPEDPIFDLPSPAPHAQQRDRVRLVGRETRHGIVNRGSRLAVDGRRACQSQEGAWVAPTAASKRILLARGGHIVRRSLGPFAGITSATVAEFAKTTTFKLSS